MKFEDLRERVKGGKLDPLSKMGKSKLTGQEIATYYRKNPKAKQAARDPMVKKAIELALDLGGNQTLAVKEIEKMKKGLSKNSAVMSALRTANEDMTSTSSVAMPEIPLGKVLKRKKDLDEETLVEKKVKYQADFGKNRMGTPADAYAEYTKYVTKKFGIKIIKTPNPKSKNHLTFEAPEKNMKQFQQFLKKNLVNKAVDYMQKKVAGEPYNEQKEKLSPAKKQYYDFNIMRTKLYRFVKAKTKAHKFGIDDLMLMTSPKVIEGMYKQNPKGFTRMLDKMYPNEKEKMTKMDFTVLGDFIDARGKVIKGQGDKVDESTSLNEDVKLYRVKDIQKPELDKFKSSARLMKLKINIKQSPRGKETIIRLEGGKKQLMDFDAVARGKSSYGDPSLIEDAVERAKETADLKDKHNSEKEQLKAKHEREKEQEKSEIDATKAESLLAQLDALEEQVDLIEKQLNEESATMKKVRDVIKKKSMMNIDGMKLDLTTASMIASVYDKVNPQNKKRMDSLKLPQLVNLTMKVAGKSRKESTELQEGQTYKSIIQGLEKDKKEVAGKSKAFGQNDTKYIDTAINFLKQLEKEGIPANQISQVDFVTNRVPKFFIGPANKSPSLSKFTPNDVKKAVAHAKKLGIIKESTELPFSSSILERMSGVQNKSTDFIKVPKLTSIEQGRMVKIKKRFPKLPEPVVYEIMRLTHKGNKVDSRKFVEIGNLYDKDYVGGTGGKFIQKLRNMGARLPQGHMGEAVSPAQQAAIAISKKERGEKPKDKTDECADEKDFKPHKMYKGDKEVMANTYADHVKYDKMGYTHEKPKSEALDAKDEPFVKDLIKKLRGGSKTHAKQADDLEKALKTENRAKRDAMKDMGKNDDKDDDDIVATDDDRKAADKNVIMQIRRVADLPKGGQIELPNGKKVKMDRKSAIALNKKFDSIRKPQDKLKLQNMMNDKKISVVALKRLLGK